MSDIPLFSARNLSCVFGRGISATRAVDGIDFDIHSQEIISVVGESGSGKTTLARMMLYLQAPTGGTLTFMGRPITDPKQHWQQVQAVFQDPFSSFNQFFTVRSQLRDAFKILGKPVARAQQDERIDQALLSVNMEPERVAGKYPFELSGGQMQRLLLARIFLIRPRVLLADEPTSMIDACSRTGILEFLLDLKKKLSMTIIFITHDIGLAYGVSNRVFIMNHGKIVEQGDPESVILAPQQPYPRKLLSDIPVLNKGWLSRTRS